MGLFSWLFPKEHNSTQDKKGGVMLEGGGPVRPTKSDQGASFNQPVEYGQGTGVVSSWSSGDQLQYDRTIHPKFCAESAELYRGPQAEALNDRYQAINNGTYFTQDDSDAQPGNTQAVRDSLAETQVNYREPLPVEVSQTKTGPALQYVRVGR